MLLKIFIKRKEELCLETRPHDLAGANPTWRNSAQRHNEWQKISTENGLKLPLYQPGVGLEGEVEVGKTVL